MGSGFKTYTLEDIPKKFQMDIMWILWCFSSKNYIGLREIIEIGQENIDRYCEEIDSFQYVYISRNKSYPKFLPPTFNMLLERSKEVDMFFETARHDLYWHLHVPLYFDINTNTFSEIEAHINIVKRGREFNYTEIGVFVP